MAVKLEALRLVLADADVDRASQSAREALAAVDFPLLADQILALPAQLTPAQREVATALASVSGIDIGEFALPGSSRFRRRWLGLHPPGPLERLVDFEHEDEVMRWPLWRAWQQLQIDGDEEEAGNWLVEPLDRLVAAFEIELGDMSGYLLDGWCDDESMIELAHAAGEQALPWAKAAAGELLELYAAGKPTPESNHAAAPSEALRLAVVLPWAYAGRSLPEAWLALTPVTCHREAMHALLEVLPEQGGVAMVRERLAAEFPVQRIRTGLVVLEVLPDPDIAAQVAEALKDRGAIGPMGQGLARRAEAPPGGRGRRPTGGGRSRPQDPDPPAQDLSGSSSTPCLSFRSAVSGIGNSASPRRARPPPRRPRPTGCRSPCRSPGPGRRSPTAASSRRRGPSGRPRCRGQ